MTRKEILFILAALFAFALAAALPLLIGRFGISLAISVIQYSVLATAWTLFSGPTNYISLATAAFFGIGAYTVAVLNEVLPIPALLLIAPAIAVLLAAVVGTATLRLTGIYFVIFTFGLVELVRQLVTFVEIDIAKVFGRYIFLDVTQEQIYFGLLALLGVTFLIGWLIKRSRLGFALRVIGDDELVARHSGIDTARAKIILFSISAAITSLVGAVMAPRWTYVEPSIAFNAMLSFQVVIMALFGGVSRLWGPLVGVVPLTLLFETINANLPNYATLITGIVFLLIVYVMPRGVAGLIDDVIAMAAAKSRAKLP